MPTNNESLVSLVITTKNEEEHIENCLISISEQTYPQIEIIVVDNFSTDKTKEISKKYTTHVFDKGPERSAQRNFGMIHIAKGKYVMFVDADMILSPSLVESCVAEIKQKNCLALHITEVILGNSFWCKVRRFERSFYDGTVIDGARFFLKKAFTGAGGFDETISGPEDWDLDKKIKTKGRIELLKKKVMSNRERSNWHLFAFIRELGTDLSIMNNVIYHNESNFCFTKYISKKSYYAKSFDKYIKKWGKDDLDIKKQFGLYYRYFGVFFEKKKRNKLFKHIHLSIGMYLLRFLVGIRFMLR